MLWNREVCIVCGSLGRSFRWQKFHSMITGVINYLWSQAESIQHREELLQEMESVSQLTARQSKLEEEEQLKRARELREQVIHL